MKTSTWALIVAALLTPALGAQQPTPNEILEGLKAGNARYVAGESEARPMGPGVRRSLAHEQAPKAVIVTCADSRVVPEHLFNAGLGEIYVLRVAGNVADPDTVAGLEHATVELGAQAIVVLGHEHCTTVAAALAAQDTTPAIARLLERIQPAVQKARALGLESGELVRAAEEENVHHAVEDALRQSQVLRSLRESGRIVIARAHYSLTTGEVEWLEDRPFGVGMHAAPGGETAGAIPGLPPHVALRMLQAGHRRYLSAAMPTGDLSPERREEIAAGQRPLAIVVTDGDSRIPPEHIFDLGLGEIVTIRVAGPVLNDGVLASIEHAAAQTGASLCLVLGNKDNGIIRKAFEGQLDQRPMTESMRQLAERIAPTVHRSRTAGGSDDQVLTRATAMLLQRFVEAANKQSPTLRHLESRGTFAMLAAIYELESGDLTWVKTLDNANHEGHDAHGHDDHAAGHGNHGHDDHAAGHGTHGHDDHATGHGNHGHDDHAAGHGSHGHDDHAAGHGNHGHDDHAAGHGTHGHDDHAAGHGTHGHDDHAAGHGTHGHDDHAAGHGTHGHDDHAAGHGNHGHDDHAAGHGTHGHDDHAAGHGTHGHDDHAAGHGTHGHDDHAAGHDAHGHDGALDTDEHLLASMADAREHGLDMGHGEGHEPAAATPKKDDSMTILLIVITGLLAAGVGVSLLLWLQRQQTQSDGEPEAAVEMVE